MHAASAAPRPAPELASLLGSLRVADPLDIGPCRLLPLLGDPLDTDADLVEEALARGEATISEIDGREDVGRVRVSHAGRRPLLVLYGDELVGAKQNRMTNASFLVRPGAPIDLPVSCVEGGRWRYASPRFASPGLSPAASKGARFSGIIGGQGATRLREGGLRQTAAAGA